MLPPVFSLLRIVFLVDPHPPPDDMTDVGGNLPRLIRVLCYVGSPH